MPGKWVGIQVDDVSKAVKQMKKAGIKSAKPNEYPDDEVHVDKKDYPNLKAWMLKNGWDKQDFDDIYPELNEVNTTSRMMINEIHRMQQLAGLDIIEEGFGANLKQSLKRLKSALKGNKGLTNAISPDDDTFEHFKSLVIKNNMKWDKVDGFGYMKKTQKMHFLYMNEPWIMDMNTGYPSFDETYGGTI